MRKTPLKLFGLLTLAFSFAFALPQRAAADDDDPPIRVARLSSTRGSVSFNPAGTDDWVEAVINRPMTTGDKLWADRGARAELHIGSASIRISGNTGFAFLNLTDDTTQLQLTEGTLRVRVKRFSENEIFEIDTPNIAFSILRPGIYELNVNEAGDATVVQVRAGQGEVTGGGSAYTLHAHETATFSGFDQLSADIDRRGFDDDDFDRWCSDRDRREDRSISARYVSDDVIGYDDLDDYGGWRPVPQYGNVWFPHVTVVGWAPYRYGHWVWINPWGWTWVDDEPWGFAPFHYGRWVAVGGVWGWVPCSPRTVVGVAYVRPVYAPALVAWVGGPHFAVGIGSGGGPVGWFPLGPREVYVPSYRVSRTYVTNVNISNTTVNNVTVNNYYNNVIVNKNVNVTNVNYVNRTAVTATSGRVFTSAQPVARNMVRVDAREVVNAPVVATTPGVAPQQRSLLGAGAESRARPPAAAQNRTVVAKTAPPPPPAPFVRQRQAIEANGGRPVTASETRQNTGEDKQPMHPNVRMASPPRRGVPPDVQAPAQSQQTVNPNRPNGSNENRPPQGNAPPQQPANPRVFRDRPPSSRPDIANPPNPRIEQKPLPPQQRDEPQRANEERQRQIDQRQQQQAEQLRRNQDRERQRVEQQQQQQQQKIEQQRSGEDRQRQIQQKQQQQLEQLERKHDQEQQKLQQRQQQERARQENRPQPKQDKPEKPDKPPKDDRPHNR